MYLVHSVLYDPATRRVAHWVTPPPRSPLSPCNTKPSIPQAAISLRILDRNSTQHSCTIHYTDIHTLANTLGIRIFLTSRASQIALRSSRRVARLADISALTNLSCSSTSISLLLNASTSWSTWSAMTSSVWLSIAEKTLETFKFSNY